VRKKVGSSWISEVDDVGRSFVACRGDQVGLGFEVGFCVEGAGERRDGDDDEGTDGGGVEGEVLCWSHCSEASVLGSMREERDVPVASPLRRASPTKYTATDPIMHNFISF
jgi:hypothetical protein